MARRIGKWYPTEAKLLERLRRKRRSGKKFFYFLFSLSFIYFDSSFCCVSQAGIKLLGLKSNVPCELGVVQMPIIPAPSRLITMSSRPTWSMYWVQASPNYMARLSQKQTEIKCSCVSAFQVTETAGVHHRCAHVALTLKTMFYDIRFHIQKCRYTTTQVPDCPVNAQNDSVLNSIIKVH